MAEKLEAQGKEGKIVFIDGSPDMSRFLGRGLLDGDSYHIIENNLLIAILGNYLPADSLKKIKDTLVATKNYQEKVAKLFEILPANRQHYRPYFSSYVKNTIKRTYAFKIDEKPQTKIKADCLLCKAKDNMLPDGYLTEDYGLSELLEKKLKIASFSGTHTTIIENLDLARAINEFFN